MECRDEKCEYVCDTPLGSYCTLTNEPLEITKCYYEEQKELEQGVKHDVWEYFQ